MRYSNVSIRHLSSACDLQKHFSQTPVIGFGEILSTEVLNQRTVHVWVLDQHFMMHWMQIVALNWSR